MLIMNRAVLVLLIFAALLGYRRFCTQYGLSVQETYYQSITLQLEGENTPEKENCIETERERYEYAFDQIDRVDALVDAGEIGEKDGESMKSAYYSEVAFFGFIIHVYYFGF